MRTEGTTTPLEDELEAAEAPEGPGAAMRAAEDYLLDLELFGMSFGLDRMRRLMSLLGEPQERFASIHVVGTNGKSSVARMTAAILERHGARTGTYTSPHLRSFTERIEVAERPIAADDFAAAVARAAQAAELLHRSSGGRERVTQFEALTAAAFYELAHQGVDVAVVEAGLGGRHDATNVLASRVQVLTGVSLEHTRWLGGDLRSIAEEKLAVVPDGGCLVVGELAREAEVAAEQVACRRDARLLRAPANGTASQLRVPGAFQRRNFALAATAADAFAGSVGAAALRGAGARIEIPGRLEVVAEHPLTVYDAAHNPAGAAALAEALPEVVGARPLCGLFAVLEDKDAEGILAPLLPGCQNAVFCRCANARSLDPEALVAVSSTLAGPPVETVADPREALDRARQLAGPDGAVLASGSVYLLADLVRPPGAARASSL